MAYKFNDTMIPLKKSTYINSFIEHFVDKGLSDVIIETFGPENVYTIQEHEDPKKFIDIISKIEEDEFYNFTDWSNENVD